MSIGSLTGLDVQDDSLIRMIVDAGCLLRAQWVVLIIAPMHGLSTWLRFLTLQWVNDKKGLSQMQAFY